MMSDRFPVRFFLAVSHTALDIVFSLGFPNGFSCLSAESSGFRFRSKNWGTIYLVHFCTPPKVIQTCLNSADHVRSSTWLSVDSSQWFNGSRICWLQIRRQSTWELKVFKERWNKSVEEDKNWVDPFLRYQRRRKPRRQNVKSLNSWPNQGEAGWMCLLIRFRHRYKSISLYPYLYFSFSTLL